MRRFILAAALLPGLSACAHPPADYSGVPEVYIVFFQTNSADLTTDAYPLVQRAADAVDKLKPQSVIVAGFSDRQGSEAANHKLSDHRTAIVEKTLVDLGVDPRIITVLPLGPAADNLGPTGDRRIEIRLIKDNSAAPGAAEISSSMK